jgi:predicted ester cyclase
MRQTFALLFLFTFLISSCGDNKEGTDNTVTSTDSVSNDKGSKEERNKDIIRNMYQAMNNHDTTAFLRDCDPDFKDYNDGSMGVMNLDSCKKMMAGWMAAFPDMKIENAQYFADGDHVLSYGEYNGTWKGDMMGMKANNKSIKTRDVDIWKFNDEGKIIEHRNVQNWDCVMGMQLGMQPPTGEKKKS